MVPIQNQHPMQMAQRALTVSLISRGRFILGLGMTHQPSPRACGASRGTSRAQAQTNSSTVCCHCWRVRPPTRPVKSSPPERTDDRGSPKPDGTSRAGSSQLLRIAGRRTAGTCTWMTGPKTLAGHVSPTLRQAAADAGRPEDASGGGRAAGERHRRRRRRPQARRRAVLDVRRAAVLPRHARPRRVRRPEDAAIIGDEATVRDRLAELKAAASTNTSVATFDSSPEGGRARARCSVPTTRRRSPPDSATHLKIARPHVHDHAESTRDRRPTVLRNGPRAPHRGRRGVPHRRCHRSRRRRGATVWRCPSGAVTPASLRTGRP